MKLKCTDSVKILMTYLS